MRPKAAARSPRSARSGDTAAADALVARAVAAFGRLDVMVTNAGVLRDRVLWKMTDEDFDLVMHTHLRGTFTCARAAAVQMRAQEEGGRIIVVGSPAGQRGNFGQTNYAAAKAGIAAFARTWAMELARSEITVNAIVPTAWTQMTASIPIYEPLVERVEAGDPLPREVRQAHAIGMPEDSAALVVFLASDAAANVTGQAIGIGGDRLDDVVASVRDRRRVQRGWLDRGADRRELGGHRRRRRAELRHRAAAPAPGGVGAMKLDLERLVAIDVHTHAERNAGEEQDPVTGEILEAAARYFGGSPPQPTAQEVADYYRERNMAAVIFTVDDEAGMGRRRIGNAGVLEAAAANPDVLIPFASVDPRKGKLGVREARELVERASAASSSTPTRRRSGPTTATTTRSTR